MSVEYLHTMIRISDVGAALKFFCDGLGLKELRRVDNEKGRFTLIFLASEEDAARNAASRDGKGLPPGLPMIELTHNWDPETLEGGRNFGHLAYKVDNVYEACERFRKIGVTINRPPRDGNMAFVRSPDGISVELLQKGDPLPPQEPWASAENVGTW